MPGPTNAHAAEVSFTLRQPPYSYLHVRVQSIPTGSSRQVQPPLDEITVRQYLAFAMQQYLGLTGAAIPFDILKVEEQQSWVRVPYEDHYAVLVALSQWTSSSKNISLQVLSSGSWLGARNGQPFTRALWSLGE